MCFLASVNEVMSDCSVVVLEGFSQVSKETRGWKTLGEMSYLGPEELSKGIKWRVRAKWNN